MTTRIVHAKAKHSAQSNGHYLDSELVHDLQNRLHCLEGHIRGIERMLDEQAACEELLIQTGAVRAALNQINIKIIQGLAISFTMESIEDNEKSVALEQLSSALAQVLKNG